MQGSVLLRSLRFSSTLPPHGNNHSKENGPHQEASQHHTHHGSQGLLLVMGGRVMALLVQLHVGGYLWMGQYGVSMGQVIMLHFRRIYQKWNQCKEEHLFCQLSEVLVLFSCDMRSTIPRRKLNGSIQHVSVVVN